MIFKHDKKIQQRGFSLFETLVAIFILMVAIAGAMSLTQKSLSSSAYSKDQVIASFLAQDAIEYIRNIRDYNYDRGQKLQDAGINWDESLESCMNKHCRIDTTMDYTTDLKSALNECDGCGEPPDPAFQLYFNTTTGAYAPNNGGDIVPSQFYRDTEIVYPGAASDTGGAMIRVTVTWKTGAFNLKSTVVNAYIRDWGKYDDSFRNGRGGAGDDGGDDRDEDAGGAEEAGGAEGASQAASGSGSER